MSRVISEPYGCSDDGSWRAAATVIIGKEANELEQVETGLIDELEEVLTVYEPDGSENLRVMLHGMSVKEAMALTGLSRRQVYYLRAGQRRLSTKQWDSVLACLANRAQGGSSRPSAIDGGIDESSKGFATNSQVIPVVPHSRSSASSALNCHSGTDRQ